MATMREYLSTANDALGNAVDRTTRWANSLRGGRGIPGIDVTERPMTARFNGVDVTERPMYSSERASFGVPEGRAPAGSTGVAPGGPGSMRPGAGLPLDGGAPGGTARTGLRRVAGVLGDMAAPLALGAAAAEGLQTPTERYRKRFGLETSDPSLIGDLGVRALGVASDVGNVLGFGLPGRFYRDNQDESGLVTTAPAGGSGVPGAPMLGSRDPVQPPSTSAVLSPAYPTVTSPARGYYTDVGSDPAFDARGAVSPQNEAAANALAARYGELQRGLTLRGGLGDQPNLPAGAGALIAPVTKPVRYSGILAEPTQRQLDRQREMDIAAEGNATTRRGQDLNYDATTRGQDIGARTTMRGQDLTYGASIYGTDSTARSAALKARLDQFNADRNFGLETQKFGQTTLNSNREARASENADLQKQIEARFTTVDDKGNVVPDKARAASFQTAVLSTLPVMIQRLQATGTPAALAKAKELQDRGPAALGADDYDRLQQLFNTRDRVQQSSGNFQPGSANFVQSNNLLDYEQTGLQKRPIGGDRVTLRGGGDVSTEDLKYTEPGNSIFPNWFKTPSRDLTRGLRLQ